MFGLQEIKALRCPSPGQNYQLSRHFSKRKKTGHIRVMLPLAASRSRGTHTVAALADQSLGPAPQSLGVCAQKPGPAPAPAHSGSANAATARSRQFQSGSLTSVTWPRVIFIFLKVRFFFFFPTTFRGDRPSLSIIKYLLQTHTHILSLSCPPRPHPVPVCVKISSRHGVRDR